MKYYYNMRDTYNHPDDEYWTADKVRSIQLIPANDNDDGEKLIAYLFFCLWPVYDCDHGHSWEFAECKDEDEAYELLLHSLNTSIHERLHDL